MALSVGRTNAPWALDRSMRLNRRLLRCAVALALGVFLIGAGCVEARPHPTVAVVLGGGAARGFSHIGFLKALEEEGIPVDILVGTSMGSIVAGLYAAGFSTENLEHIVTHVDFTELFSPIIPPKGGILATERFETFLDTLTAGKRLEDAAIPFYSVITNLVTGEEVALNHGPLSRGVLASMSIPGMFPPVKIGDAYFVDGGMKSPVPVQVAKDVGADFIIAIDVRRELGEIDHDHLLTNLQLALFFLLDDNTIPQLEMADVVIAPQVQTDSYMEYERAAFFIEEGYRATKAAIPEIKERLLALDPDFPFGARPAPRGLTPETLDRRLKEATGEARPREEGIQLHPAPAVEFAPGEPPTYRVGVRVPFTQGDGLTLQGTYAVQRRAPEWGHTVGIGVGTCNRLCATLYARRSGDDLDWRVGASLLGNASDRLEYSAAWEGGVPGAQAVYRIHFPGESRNILELLSGSMNWFIGGGAKASWSEGLLVAHPLAEAGVVFEGRLFGLFPLRSRLSLHLSGGDQPWRLRWTIVE